MGKSLKEGYIYCLGIKNLYGGGGGGGVIIWNDDFLGVDNFFHSRGDHQFLSQLPSG